MALQPGIIPKLTARLGVMRVGNFRLGFIPTQVKTGGFYLWKEKGRPVTAWKVKRKVI